MAAAAKEAIHYPLHSVLFLKTQDDTFYADRSIDLCHFLFLVIHHDTYFKHPTYPLNPEGRAIFSHPAVWDVLSKLARAIMAGDPPECPPISFENASPRLKNLTLEQKWHLERILCEGVPGVNPLFLKDIRQMSPYDFSVNKRPPWTPRSLERISRFKMGSSSQGEGERHAIVMSWHDHCIQHTKQEEIKYAFAKKGGPLEGTQTLVKGFVSLVVAEDETSHEFHWFCDELKRRKVPYPGKNYLISDLFWIALMPTIVNSELILRPFFESTWV